jgi:hypothetical protein
MATGIAGSSLITELNRLAGITTLTSYQGFQKAANTYAGTTGLGIIAALNYKASPSRTVNNFKDLNAVCNELAGADGTKSATDALRSISV